MKILIINKHPQDGLGGSEIQCDIIARKFQEIGHSVLYLAINGKEKYESPYPFKSIKLCPREIARATIQEKPDIVYWRYDTKALRKTARLFYKLGIPFVFAASSLNNTKKWISLTVRGVRVKHLIMNVVKIIKGRYNYLAFKWVSGVTVNNELYLHRLPVKKEAYIPNSMESQKKEFNWDKPFVFWVANLKPQKRPEICIELAKKIKDLGVDLIMVGRISGRSYDFFKSKDKLPVNLHYLGPKTLEEVNGILNKSICLVHTCTQEEGFSNNFIQAWLQGKPVVSYEFDPGGLIQREGLGLVSKANMNQFISDTKKLINDKILNKEIGDKAKSFAEKHFHPEINIRKLEKFLLEILENQQENRSINN